MKILSQKIKNLKVLYKGILQQHLGLLVWLVKCWKRNGPGVMADQPWPSLNQGPVDRVAPFWIHVVLWIGWNPEFLCTVGSH